MRTIKFRAWHKKNKKMYLWNNLETRTEWLFDKKWRKNHFGKDLVVMQFTGLKDKNGKEIYEGDIVRIKDGGWWTFDEYVDAIVDYTPPEFIFKDIDFEDEIESETCPVSNFMHLGDGTSRKYDKNKHERFEIIGNIYENKELIK